MSDLEFNFFAILLTPILLVLILHFLNAVYQSLRETEWHKATGIIDESSIQHDHDGDPQIHLRYQFHVDQQPYWGNQTIRGLNQEVASKLIARLPVGATVIIVFQPNDPEQQSRVMIPKSD